MFTTQGGVDIEQVAEESPDALVAAARRPARGLPAVAGAAARLRRRRRGPGRAEADRRDRREALRRLRRQFDAMLCEINPLIVTPDGEVKALDSKFTVDDNALYRHPDIAEMRDTGGRPARGARAREGRHLRQARRRRSACSATAPGSTMSTVDVVAFAGGRPANFCDLGGGGDAQGVVDALEVITRDPQVKAIFFNIFGGITRCDEVARGILQALAQMAIDAPDRRPARRHERGGGRRDPRRGGAAEPPRRADDARGGAGARWSWRHDAMSGRTAQSSYRRAPTRIARAPTST